MGRARVLAAPLRRTLRVDRKISSQSCEARSRRAYGRRLATSGTTGVLVSGGSTRRPSSPPRLASRPARCRPTRSCSPSHETMDESRSHRIADSAARRCRARVVPVRGKAVRSPILWLSSRRFELPWHSPNLMINLPVMSVARGDGVGVLLDGEGGDELFGLSRYLLADLRPTGAHLLGPAARQLACPRSATNRRLQRAVVREFGVKGALPYSAHALPPPCARHRATTRRRGSSPGCARLYLEHDDAWSWKRLPGPRWWAYLAYLLTAGVRRWATTGSGGAPSTWASRAAIRSWTTST